MLNECPLKKYYYSSTAKYGINLRIDFYDKKTRIKNFLVTESNSKCLKKEHESYSKCSDNVALRHL